MDHDVFWKYIQNEFGQVQKHLRNIIELQNLCNHSITYLTREAIMGIQKDMRAMAGHLSATCNRSANPKALTLSDIYGNRWATNPKQFTFMEGEILCLLGLASCVQQRGIESFLKFKNQPHVAVTHNASSIQNIALQKSDTAESHAYKLISKIRAFYAMQQISDPKFDKFTRKLEKLEVHSLTITDNEVRASIVCPICAMEGNERKINFKMDPYSRWHIFSYKRHCDAFHYEVPRGTKRKRCLEIDNEETDDTMDDCS
ncbi:uncharacterized protein LOC5566027 [Aedes aegypti]|uniref:Uncharacterized protein n=1 Tax=Aedes aegypti TaxID=7159 RepID=A0A1S4F9U0_AEDAE|nr:uncharacterized protein LOC5566027 [Aedes aegypti]